MDKNMSDIFVTGLYSDRLSERLIEEMAKPDTRLHDFNKIYEYALELNGILQARKATKDDENEEEYSILQINDRQDKSDYSSSYEHKKECWYCKSTQLLGKDDELNNQGITSKLESQSSFAKN